MVLRDLLERLGVGLLLHTPGTPAPGGADQSGLGCHRAPDVPSALLLAEAAGTMGGGLGAVLDGEVLTLLSRPPYPPYPPNPTHSLVPVASPAQLVAEVARARRSGDGAVRLHLGFDPAVPLDPPAPLDPLAARDDPSLAARFPTVAPGSLPADLVQLPVDLVVAGRGVVRAGAAGLLRAFAERTGLGVLNTFTAKGLFRWDSPFHLGTGGLQELDLALAFAGAGRGAGTVVTVGLDTDEWPEALARAAGVPAERIFGLAPGDLAAAAAVLRPGGTVDAGRPRLYRDLAAVVQPLYGRTEAPLNPARAAADVAEMLPEGAAVWTEPGLAGLWVARALPTTRLGSVRVPPVGSVGVAVAGALGAALRPGGVAVAVVDSLPADGAVPTLLDWAAAGPGTVVIEIWGVGGTASSGGRAIGSAGEHRERLAAALTRPGVHVIEVPVDYRATDALVGACGPPVAWPGRVPARPVTGAPADDST
ncbi:thiamine pyrophosphate-dependent enzyme, possible carboligase or decarboxylase [Frankia sp. EI5c]|uniref:hypothetical protein n=1 Tax=Frankia sp. EI5c TaxID=683316 RepID=UPI0007C24D36|nr:hypothetical protein [Frankia sp. EI5c]OAA27764.1 thiamine pyrophosphate-dependent enzyme, possible carboligase or decarboxylase [Frankia sp. EI5c]